MSKSMPIMIDTSYAATKLMKTSTSTDTSTVINLSLSKIRQSSSIIPPVHQSFSPVANVAYNGEEKTATFTTTATTFKNPKNIKVITPRYQNAASTKNSKSHANTSPTGLAVTVCMLLMLFLVMSSICLVKHRRKSMEFDKNRLIGTNDLVHGSECELNIRERNIYLV